MTKQQGSHGPERDGRPPRVNPRHKDNYPHKEKTKNALVCTKCGVVNHEGRWYWGAPPETEVEAALCPACTRIRERDARGTLRLDGSFTPYREEILGLVRNLEEAEKAEHPLERLMEVRDTPEGIVVTTTGVHLARGIANKLARRFHKKSNLRYEDGEQRVFVDWKKD